MPPPDDRHPMFLHLEIRVEPASWPAFRAFLSRARGLYESPGGIRVRLLRHTADPSRLIEVVEYDDRATFDADQERVTSDPRWVDALREWRTLLRGAPGVTAWEDVTHQLEGPSRIPGPP